MNGFRFVLTLMAGCLLAILVAGVGTVIARTLWPAYAAAEPHKTYTLTMLLMRLTVGALSVAAAAFGTSAVARDQGRTTWWLGCLFVALSIPSHVYPGYSWHDYPVWYHLIYLFYLVPVAGLTGRVWRVR